MRPPDVERVGAAVEHAAHPVERGVRVRPPHRLVQRRDLVVERLAALVETTQAPRDRLLDERGVDVLDARVERGDRELLDQVDEPAPVAVGVADQRVLCRGGDPRARHRGVHGAIEERRELVGRERLEHIDGRARQQRADHLERRVLRGRADERDHALLDERQEGVLLRLVEAVHLVDEQDRRAPRLRAHDLGARDGLADLLHAGEHGGDRDEVRVERIRHQARERGLADARRPPQDHRVQLAGVERHRERLAGPEQVALADHLVDRARPQALGERHGRGWRGGKEVLGDHGRGTGER